MFESKKDKSREVETVFSLINIIFLLIVFFLVAGHINSNQWHVKPPLVDKTNDINKQTCTLYIKTDGIFYQTKKVALTKKEINQINQSCKGQIILAAEANLSATKMIIALNRLKSSFKQIEVLVSSHI
ncbi:biopolymer transporter ExbD [bacterium SCSIO 12844]|nr:biopolymer transporter ExbD [bacterium SCSIO 12844]